MFLASGALPPKPPARGGLRKALPPPLDSPRQRLITGGVAAPFKVQGSNAVIQSKQDNQAPHPTISHLETDCSNSTAASFARK